MSENLEVAIYLRKSRDEEQQGTEDTLARHRAVLMSMVESLRLVLVDVFEEVVSGESLYARPEMMKLLEAVQSGKYDAVLCMDIDRLGRGGMSNQGLILDAFKFSETKIITPDKTYDISDETDEQLLEFKTFMSRQEYRMINKRLQRGKQASIREGCYISNAPYGYRNVKADKKPTLEIVEEEARFIRMIFNMYCDGHGATKIADRLNALGSVPHRSAVWNRNSVRHILKNPTFCGKVVWNKKTHIRKGVRGNDKHIVKYNPMEEWDIFDGLHEAIISEEQYELAKKIREKRAFPRFFDGTIKSALAGIMVCAKCGSNMQKMNQHKSVPYLLCNTAGCCAGAKYEYVEESLIEHMREHLQELQHELASAAAPGTDYAGQLAAVGDMLERLAGQKNKLYEFLEQGIYSVEEYRERMDALKDRLVAVENERATLVKENERANRQNKIALRNRLAYVLDTYDGCDAAERNALLKSVLQKVKYTKKKKTKPHDFSLELQYLSEYL